MIAFNSNIRVSIFRWLLAFTLSVSPGLSRCQHQQWINYYEVMRDSGAWDSNEKTGHWTEYHFRCFASETDRTISLDSLIYYDSVYYPLAFFKSSGNYEKGKRSGVWRSQVAWQLQQPIAWKPFSSVEYQDGLREGWEQVVNDNGQCKQFYKHGIKDSVYICSANEKPTFIIRYKDGVQHGAMQMFDEAGNPALEVIFQKGIDAKITTWKNGEVNYIDGEEISRYANGTLKSKMHYVKGEQHGLQQSFYANGKLHKEMTFEHGKLHGDYRSYYDNGQLEYELLYNEGKPWEIKQYFTRKGKPAKSGDLINGTGSLIKYTEHGKIEKIEYYKNGAIEHQ